MACTTPFISYHQFLTRPISGSILNLPRLPTNPQSKLKPSLRELLAIKHPDVHDLCFEILWERIFDSLDGDHDISVCNCCRGKGPASDGMQRNFVVVICGDLRRHASSGRSWACETLQNLFQNLPAEFVDCELCCTVTSQSSSSAAKCSEFKCPRSRKAVTLSTTEGSDEFEIFGLHEVPLFFDSLQTSAFLNRSFHLSITSISDKQLSILVVPPHFVTDSGSYKCLFSKRCFIDMDLLPTSLAVRERDFAVIGVLGEDYATFPIIKTVMRTFALRAGVSAKHSGYPVLWSILKHFVTRWRAPETVTVKYRKVLKSELAPRKPVSPIKRTKTTRKNNLLTVTPQSGSRAQRSLTTINPSSSDSALVDGHQDSTRPSSRPGSKAATTSVLITRSHGAVTATGTSAKVPASCNTTVDKLASRGHTKHLLSSANRRLSCAEKDQISPQAFTPVAATLRQRDPLPPIPSRCLKRVAFGTPPPAKRRNVLVPNNNISCKIKTDQRNPAYWQNATSNQLSSRFRTFQDGSMTTKNPLRARKFARQRTNRPSVERSRNTTRMTSIQSSTTKVHRAKPRASSASLDLLPRPSFMMTSDCIPSPAGSTERLSSNSDGEPPPSCKSVHRSECHLSRVNLDPEIPREFIGVALGPDVSEQHDAFNLSPTNQAVESPVDRPNCAVVSGEMHDPNLDTDGDETIPRLPFNLKRSVNKDVPLKIQTLRDLTARLLLARQRGRDTDYSTLWSLEAADNVRLDGVVRASFNATFDGQIISGLRLIQLTTDDLEAEDPKTTKKICAFGCTKNGKRRHLSNTRQQRYHQRPRANPPQDCNFVPSLCVNYRDDYFIPRNLSELGGLDIYFKVNDQDTGHLTSLFSVGGALLYDATNRHHIEEMYSWKGYEAGGAAVFS